MIITCFDIENIVYKVLDAAGIVITGGIYKHRPINSGKEDIVIGAQPISGEQVQQCLVFVNIHVPNLCFDNNGIQDNTQPNLKRLNELTQIVWGLLDETYKDTYWFFITAQSIVADANQTNEHYSNIQINFNSLNTSN